MEHISVRNSLFGLNKGDVMNYINSKDVEISRLTSELERMNSYIVSIKDENKCLIELINHKEKLIETLNEDLAKSMDKPELKQAVLYLTHEKNDLFEKLRMRENEISILRAGLAGYKHSSDLKTQFIEQIKEKDELIVDLTAELEMLKSANKEINVSENNEIKASLHALLQENNRLTERIKALEIERDKIPSALIMAQTQADNIIAQAKIQANTVVSQAENQQGYIISESQRKADIIKLQATSQAKAYIEELDQKIKRKQDELLNINTNIQWLKDQFLSIVKKNNSELDMIVCEGKMSKNE